MQLHVRENVSTTDYLTRLQRTTESGKIKHDIRLEVPEKRASQIIFLFISHFILDLVPPQRIKLRSATRYPAVERFNIIKRDFSEHELVFGVKNSANAPLVSMNPVQNFAALLFFVCL